MSDSASSTESDSQRDLDTMHGALRALLANDLDRSAYAVLKSLLRASSALSALDIEPPSDAPAEALHRWSYVFGAVNRCFRCLSDLYELAHQNKNRFGHLIEKPPVSLAKAFQWIEYMHRAKAGRLLVASGEQKYDFLHYCVFLRMLLLCGKDYMARFVYENPRIFTITLDVWLFHPTYIAQGHYCNVNYVAITLEICAAHNGLVLSIPQVGAETTYNTSTRPAVQAHGQGQVAPRGEFIKVIMKPKKPKLVTTTRKSMYSIPDNGSDDDHNGGSKDGSEDATGYQPDFATEDNTMHEEDTLTTRDQTPSTRLAPGLPTPMPTQSRAPLMDTAVVPMAQMTPAQVSAERHVAASRKRQSGAEPVGGVQPMPKRQHLGSSSKEQDQPNDRSSPEALEVTHTSKKPKAGDYAEDVAPVLIRASQEYEARIYSKGAFPESLAQIRHANLCLRHASRTLGIKTKLTTSIGRVIKVRGSTIRGRSITIVRKLVETQYGFALPERPLTSNIKLSAYLLEDNRYMHKNIENTDQYLAEHPIVPRVLQEVIFPQSKGAAAMGVVYEKYFNPISLNTLALIFSQVRHCILEWSSGKLVPKDYTEKIAMQGEAFTTLLKDLQDWEDADPDLTKKLRAKMFKKAKNLSNVQGQSTTSVPRLTAERKRRIAAHLATRTGDTDSEVEDEDEAGSGAGDENVGAAGASRG
ncbi:hypothetical protein GGF50DRAFT_90269 [Schizophyllum commune]